MNPLTMEAVYQMLESEKKHSIANTSSSSIDMISKDFEEKLDILSEASNDIDMNAEDSIMENSVSPKPSNSPHSPHSPHSHSPKPAENSPKPPQQPRKSRSLFYTIMKAEVEGILEDETDFLANTGNIASLMYNKFHKSFGKDSVNWLGFYFVRTINNGDGDHSRKELRLGTFHGKYACVHIPFGKGVCGTAAVQRVTQVVPDVHLFPGHIACDEASESEIVVPMIDNDGELIGVLDIDCPHKYGFNEQDKIHLEKIVQDIVQGCKWPKNGKMIW